MKFVGGFLVCLLSIGVAGAFMVYGGRLAIGATTPPDILDRMASIARDKAIARNAPSMHFNMDADAAKRGMEHYRENCMACHGAPGCKSMEFAQGMNPKPPDLDGADTQAFSDGELFWTVKNGIRASGMPAFSVNHQDAEIQDIVAFVRHLPQLTATEKSDLAGAAHDEHHHHEEGAAAGNEERGHRH